MARRLKFLLVLTVLLSFLPVRSAEAQQRNKLRIGDQAPQLDVEKWMNGSFSGFESGTTYFVFFFEVQDDLDGMLSLIVLEWLKGLTALYDFEVVGVTSSSEGAVQRFISQIEGDLSVPVGIDSRKKTRRAWVDASGADTIQGGAMFVVDAAGKVQYAGTGQETDREELFPLILSQRFDAGLLRRTEALRRAKDTARTVGNWRLFEQHHAELMELDRRVFALENIDKFESLLLDRSDRAAAYAFVKELTETYADDPRFLMDLARYIADSPKLTAEQRDLDMAMTLAKQARNTMRDDNPGPIALEALVLLRQGDVDAAVRTQRRAFRVAPTALKAKYQRTLDDYQKLRDQRRGG